MSADLATTYLGLALPSPIVASASPLTADAGNLIRLERAGAGAVVLPSLFEEQIEAERRELFERMTAGNDRFAEALSYFPDPVNYAVGTEAYLALVRTARAALRIPVIASLNGTSVAGWIDFARRLEEAGASALELNIYFIPSDLALDGDAVERRYLDVLAAVRHTVRVPIAVKLGPSFSAPGAMAQALAAAGADGLVCFNRFYQPDIDLVKLQLRADLELSTKREIRLPLLWIALLAGNLSASLAATTGVETSDEVVKYLLAGADVVMTTSALLRHGPDYLGELVAGLRAWLDARGLAGVGAIRGRMSRGRVRDPLAFERANYIRVIEGYMENVRA